VHVVPLDNCDTDKVAQATKEMKPIGAAEAAALFVWPD